MPIVKKGDNTWLVRIFLGRDTNGKQQFHNHTVHGTKKDAQTYENKVRRERDLGEWIEPSQESLGFYLQRWLRDAAGPRIAPATADMYAEFLRSYVKPSIASLRLDKVAPLDIQGFYSGLAERGIGPARIRRVHGMLSSALNQAVKWKLLKHNPASLVDLPKVPKREIHALSPDAATRFLEAATMDRHSTLWAFMLTTGVRPGEALSLRWADVDLKAGIAIVRRSLTWRPGGEYVFTEPKTKTSVRQIPLPPTLIPELKAHKAHQAEERLAAGSGWVNLDLVFATESGTPHRRENLAKRHLKRILEAAGLPPDFRLYDLRHGCATLLLANGTHPKVVAERLGHAKIALTLDTYSHVIPSMQAEASKDLDRMLFGKG